MFVGAIEVQIGNLCKEDRCSSDEVYVVGFVSSSQLPKRRPCSIDPFLSPLVTDLKDSFIDGKNTVSVCYLMNMV